jgi:hypothetical protein
MKAATRADSGNELIRAGQRSTSLQDCGWIVLFGW